MYEVKKKFQRGSEVSVGRFKTLPKAQEYIQHELEKDMLMKVNVSYALYEGFDLVKLYDQRDLETTQGGDQEGSSGSKGSRQTFNPSPFNAAPMPKGAPRSWVKDVPEDDKSNK